MGVANHIDPLSLEQAEGVLSVLPTGAMFVEKNGKILTSNLLLSNVLDKNQATLIGLDANDLIFSSLGKSFQRYITEFFDSSCNQKIEAPQHFYMTSSSDQSVSISMGLTSLKIANSECVLISLANANNRIEGDLLVERSIEAAPHGILIVNNSGLVTFANQSLCECFGYSKDDVLGKNLGMLLPHRYRHNHQTQRESFWQDPSVRMMGSGRDLTALHADGREFPVEVGLSPLNVEQKLTLVTLTDITVRKRMELELKEINTNLEEFTYVASHDLRTPLRGISDLLEWIKEDIGPGIQDEVSKNIERISIRTSRMEQMIENLLAYAKAGKLSSEIQEINISELTDDILTFLGIPSSFVVSTDFKVKKLIGTQVPLETVLRNLISNAVNHHDKDHGNIHISSSIDNSMVKFSIADDGPGIPEGAKTRIFKLFQSIGSNNKSSSGIGLSASRRLTETHGGKIDVENTDQGATFHVWWPRFIRKDTHD